MVASFRSRPPDVRKAIIRLACTVLANRNDDEWTEARRYMEREVFAMKNNHQF